MKDLLESIKHHEGFVEHVYDDALGIPTIGYGFAIKDLTLDEDIAEEILIRKLENLQKDGRFDIEVLERPTQKETPKPKKKKSTKKEESE